jgi:outer membrane protein assembly factor BamB
MAVPGTVELSLAGNRIDPNGWRVVGKAAGRCPAVDGPATRAEHSLLGLSWKKVAPADLYARDVTNHHILYAPMWHDGTRRSLLVDAISGRVILSVAEQGVAIVEDPAGRALGVLALPPDRNEVALLDPATGARRWAIPADVGGATNASVALAGDTLLIALYHRIATGSALLAVDVRTGARRWVGDVAQLEIAHSKYLNDVSITVQGRDAILLGLEAGGCHLQVFDVATGRRRLAVLEPPPRIR